MTAKQFIEQNQEFTPSQIEKNKLLKADRGKGYVHKETVIKWINEGRLKDIEEKRKEYSDGRVEYHISAKEWIKFIKNNKAKKDWPDYV